MSSLPGLNRFTAAFAVIAMVGCATTQQQPRRTLSAADGFTALKNDIRIGERVNRICFAGQINEHRGKTIDTVIVKSGLNREFILETAGTCANLKDAQSVELEDGFSCLAQSDSLLVYGSASNPDSPFSEERCTINSIHRWNEEVDPVDLGGLRPEDYEPTIPPLK